MKFKIFASAIFILCFSLNAFSQEYHPFLNHSSWITYNHIACCVPSRTATYYGDGEAIIGDQSYSEIYQMSYNGIITDTIYVREDIEARKVYKLVDGADQLLYDFTLETGDIIFYGGYEWQATVDEVQVVTGMRKRIKLRTTEPHGSHYYNQRWIEGVGSNALPFNPQCNITREIFSDGGNYTICSFQDGVNIYSEHYGDSVNCATALYTDSFASEPSIAFSPNPFVSELHIDSQHFFENGTLKLFNLQGQLVREVKNLKGGHFIINRENLIRGLYFAQLTDNEILIKSDKIIVN